MAVIRVGNRPQRSGSTSAQRNHLWEEIIQRRYKRELIVTTNSVRTGPQEILASPDLAANFAVVGAKYQFKSENDPLATCVDVQVNPTDSPYVWIVVASYDTDRIVNAATDDPLNQPPVIKWGSTKIERPLITDYLGVSVVNSSKERFDPPVTYEETRPLVFINVNVDEPDFDNSIVYTYQGTVNSEVFSGLSPGFARINTIQAEKAISYGRVYWQVSYEIEMRREGFWYYALDNGFRDKNLKLFRDLKDFTPLSNPTLLNGRGERLSDASAILDGAINNAVTTITLAVADHALLFPPGPTAGTGHWYFDIKINNEIMTVISGFGTDVWTVVRGRQGTTAAAHSSGSVIDLQPYFMRYMPYIFRDWGPLALPAV